MENEQVLIEFDDDKDVCNVWTRFQDQERAMFFAEIYIKFSKNMEWSDAKWDIRGSWCGRHAKVSDGGDFPDYYMSFEVIAATKKKESVK